MIAAGMLGRSSDLRGLRHKHVADLRSHTRIQVAEERVRHIGVAVGLRRDPGAGGGGSGAA